MDFYDDNKYEGSTEKFLIGYDNYTKEEIWDDDDYITYKGKIYLRENFLQACTGLGGEFIDPDENEE